MTVTHWPFSYSRVGRASLPAGPVPLMPNRLWSRIASALWPQPDSSMAWAIVTAAGTPYRLCAAIAPGAIALMKACWLDVSGTCDAAFGGLFLVYDGVADDEAVLAVFGLLAVPDWPVVPPRPDCSPGMAAAPLACARLPRPFAALARLWLVPF